MFGIFKKYKRLFGRDAARSFNLMAAFLTNLCGDESIDIDRPDDPSTGNPPCISVNREWLEDFVENLEEAPTAADAPLPVAAHVDNETDAQKLARIGSSDIKAPLDHVHRLPDSVLTADDIDDGTNNGAVASASHDHTASDITDLDDEISAALANYPTTSAMNTAIAAAIQQSGGGSVPSGVLTNEDIGDTVQAHSDELDALEAALDANGKVPLSQLTGNIQGHSGDCLVTIDNSGTLGHSENKAYDVLMELTDQSTVTNHVATLPFPSWASGATKTSVLVGTDGDGDLTNVMTLPASANATWDRMVVCAATGTSLSLKNVRAENPSSTLQLVAGGSTNTSAQGAAHTVADTGTNLGKGFVLPVVTRVVWTGSALVYFYTTLTFDKYGRLYSLTNETKVTIDSPVKVTWN